MFFGCTLRQTHRNHFREAALMAFMLPHSAHLAVELQEEEVSIHRRLGRLAEQPGENRNFGGSKKLRIKNIYDIWPAFFIIPFNRKSTRLAKVWTNLLRWLMIPLVAWKMLDVSLGSWTTLDQSMWKIAEKSYDFDIWENMCPINHADIWNIIYLYKYIYLGDGSKPFH